MISNSAETKKISPDIIHGFVLDRSTREPILWVNVNVVNTDEKSLTNDTGEFKIITWKNCPVTLQFEHEDFESIHLRITCSSEDLVVMLRRKYF